MAVATKEDKPRNGIAAGALLASAVGMLALPSAVLAFASNFEPRAPETDANEPIDSEAAAGNLARPVAIRSLAKGQLYLFTPANTPNRPDRSITVAVRVASGAAKAIAVTGLKASKKTETASQPSIAPTAFNLGVARGYKNFSQGLVTPARGSKGELPDLGKFSIAPSGKSGDSRFAPRIVMDETQTAGRNPRTFAGNADDRVDVGGSYRLTKNLDVTAGVRYSQERERLLPLTDTEQDSQAVYVGTQFRF